MTKKHNEIEQELLKTVNLSEFLMRKQFQLSDVGLSDKIAFDWTRAGLYLEEKKTTGRRKYNAVEYVWLRLVKDLREFGMSYQALKTLRGFLLSKIDIRKFLIEVMQTESEENEIDLKALQKLVKEVVSSTDELEQAFDSTENPLMDTVLRIIIHNTILYKGNIHLLIRKDGGTVVTDGGSGCV